VNLDDHIFNNKRLHSKYETLSVITDGLFFLLPQLVATFVTYTEQWGIIYKVLGAISMASIIKNEYFHKNLELKERLIHACLYVLHPIILFTFYESWINNYFVTNSNFWMFQLFYVGLGLKTITYQVIYWNYIKE
jgi:hypothetical protein